MTEFDDVPVLLADEPVPLEEDRLLGDLANVMARVCRPYVRAAIFRHESPVSLALSDDYLDGVAYQFANQLVSHWTLCIRESLANRTEVALTGSLFPVYRSSESIDAFRIMLAQFNITEQELCMIMNDFSGEYSEPMVLPERISIYGSLVAIRN